MAHPTLLSSGSNGFETPRVRKRQPNLPATRQPKETPVRTRLFRKWQEANAGARLDDFSAVLLAGSSRCNTPAVTSCIRGAVAASHAAAAAATPTPPLVPLLASSQQSSEVVAGSVAKKAAFASNTSARWSLVGGSGPQLTDMKSASFYGAVANSVQQPSQASSATNSRSPTSLGIPLNSTITSNSTSQSIKTGPVDVNVNILKPPPLTAAGDDFLRVRQLHNLSQAFTYTQKFMKCCKRKYNSMIRAWRQLLDPGGHGRVGFMQFCGAARQMGFLKVSILWSQLDADGTGFITLDEWDPDAFRALMEFRQICFEQYGCPELAFRYAMDVDGSGTCRKSELSEFLDYHGFTGNLNVLWDALDVDRGNFITVDELDFLASWTGERFAPSSMDTHFKFGLARLQQRNQRVKKELKKREAEFNRQAKEKESIEIFKERRKTQALEDALAISEAESLHRLLGLEEAPVEDDVESDVSAD